ncbi:hypothetical protein H6P81_018134 [Aristolochia fimbriata]|uniref:Uncharacterized protein n=1 Tax=Aristolochia fimbriata TaxID=158543 RepID=A0AAV7E049_ARIFI|nr:hypothetical protein H6P81_018134 [Aristolochia fimbriata]
MHPVKLSARIPAVLPPCKIPAFLKNASVNQGPISLLGWVPPTVAENKEGRGTPLRSLSKPGQTRAPPLGSFRGLRRRISGALARRTPSTLPHRKRSSLPTARIDGHVVAPRRASGTFLAPHASHSHSTVPHVWDQTRTRNHSVRAGQSPLRRAGFVRAWECALGLLVSGPAPSAPVI